LVVGKFDKDKFTNEIALLENKINRDINYHVYSENDISEKLKNGNTFLNKIFVSSKILLTGNLDEYYEPTND
jgi:hypothetical protein